MHERAAFALLLLAGCGDLPIPEPASEPIAPLAQSFDAADTGAIRGRVLWDGDVPQADINVVTASAYHAFLYKNPVRYATPHVPHVDAATKGVADAVVYLRGIDPRRARPWYHEPVHIAFRDRGLLIQQGTQTTNVGFMHRGDKLTTVNHDADYHALRARGAAFFTLPLIKPNKLAEVTLKQSGLVELFDAAGYYWVHAHLFVDDHPYYARTDADGRFALEQVPAGTYELVCWLPSWKVTRKDRDPETMIVARQAWAAPVERKQAVTVTPAADATVTFRWTSALFGAD